ncbi:MAG: tetratricopeptide repeat protein [Desulfobacterales bacterium]|nr:tetratricopeptide repeat protein [Desulfobacterales bacterium]
MLTRFLPPCRSIPGRSNTTRENPSRGARPVQEKSTAPPSRHSGCPSRWTPLRKTAAGAAQYMSNAYLAMGDSENAIKSLKTFIEQNSNLDTAHANLAQFLFSQDRYEEAVTEYETAVELNPTAGNRYALGQAYLQTGEYGKAEEQFMQVLRMSPDDPAPHLGLGQTYAGQGRYELAIKEFKAAMDKKWDFYDAYAEMGYAYADMGEVDTAQGLFEFLDKKAPELADLLSRYLCKADPRRSSWPMRTARSRTICPPARRYRTSAASFPPQAPPSCSL